MVLNLIGAPTQSNLNFSPAEKFLLFDISNTVTTALPVTAFTKEGILFKSFESQKQCANYFRTTPENVKAVVNGRNILLLKKYQIKLGILKENIDKAKERKPYKLSENKIPITEEKLLIAKKLIDEGNSFRKTAIAIDTNHITLAKYLKNYENRE